MPDTKCMCTKCNHMLVCKFKEKYETIQTTLDNTSVSFHSVGDKIAISKLNTIGWIKPIIPECIHFEEVKQLNGIRCPKFD